MKTIILLCQSNKLGFVIFLFALLSFHSHAQKKESDSTTRYLSVDGVNKLVYKKFSGLVTGGGTTNTMASYASLDPLNGATSFNCTAPLNKDAANGSRIAMLSMKVTGDLLSDNSLVLFQGAKINTNLGFDGQLHWGPRIKDPRIFSYLRSDKLYLARIKQSLIDQRNIDSITSIIDADHLKKKNGALKNLISKYGCSIDTLNAKIVRYESVDSIYFSDSILICLNKIKNLQKDTLKISRQIDSIQNLIDNKTFFDSKILENSLDDKYSKKLEELESNPKFSKLGFWWLSFEGGFSRKEYHEFDRDAIIFSDQVVTKDFYTYKLGISYNFFSEGSNNKIALKEDKKSSFYLNAGVVYKRDNNTSLLKTTDISEERVFKNAAGDTTRKIIDKYSAYTDSIITSDIISINANFYWTLPSSIVSFHLFPSIDSYIARETIINLGIGVLTSFKNKKKEEPALNAELYFQLIDLRNEMNRSSSNMWNRSQVGIRFSHPFNFFK